MFKGKIVGSLDVIISMLGDPKWRERAERVRSLSGLRQILVDYCEDKGEAVQIDKSTLWLHIPTPPKGRSKA